MGGSTARQTRGPWTRSAAARDTKRRSDPAWIRVPKAAIPPPHATECAAAGSRTSSCSDKVRPRRRVETLSDVSSTPRSVAIVASSAADTVMGGCLAGLSTRRQPRVPAKGGRAGSSASAVCIKSELRPGIEGAYCYAYVDLIAAGGCDRQGVQGAVMKLYTCSDSRNTVDSAAL